MEFAKKGLCSEIMPMPMAGSYNPVTLAGTLVQGNAEILAAVVLSQLIRPGAPVIYAPYCGIMDMAVGTHSFGAPEVGMMASAWVQLSRRYGIPNDTVVATSDSKCPDAQATYEKTIGMLLPALAGADTLSMCGGMIDFALQASYEQLVIDNEIIGNIKRIISGIDVNSATLAVDIINKVGHGGSFLEETHTLEHFRKEQYISRLRDRLGYQVWCAAGKKDILIRATERVQEILKHEPKCYLPDNKKEAMENVIKEIAEREQKHPRRVGEDE
jgi:trimethylamine--corrinoid protein Co-methyltransferase